MRERLNPSQSPRLWRWALALVVGGLVALGYGALWFWLGPLWPPPLGPLLGGSGRLGPREKGARLGPPPLKDF